MAPGNPTKQSYSQAIHLIFSKENKTEHLYLFFHVPISWFLLFFPCACLLPASCSLALLAAAPHPRREKSGLREYGEPHPTAHDARGEDHVITAATGAGRYGKSLAPSHRFRPGHLAWLRGHGSPGGCSWAGHCDLPPFPAFSVPVISLAASGAWVLIALTHYLKAPAHTWGIITHI